MRRQGGRFRRTDWRKTAVFPVVVVNREMASDICIPGTTNVSADDHIFALLFEGTKTTALALCAHRISDTRSMVLASSILGSISEGVIINRSPISPSILGRIGFLD